MASVVPSRPLVRWSVSIGGHMRWNKKVFYPALGLIVGLFVVPYQGHAIPAWDEGNQDWSISIEDRSKQTCSEVTFTLHLEPRGGLNDRVLAWGPPRGSERATVSFAMSYRARDGSMIRGRTVEEWSYRIGRGGGSRTERRGWTIPDDAAFDPDLKCKVRLTVHPHDEAWDTDPSNNQDSVRGFSRGNR